MTTIETAAASPASSLVLVASWAADLPEVRGLINGYVDWLAVAADTDPATVQPTLSSELATLDSCYAPPTDRMVGVRVGDEMVGTAGVHVRAHEVIELKRVYRRSSARGRNLGRRLVEAAIREAERLGGRRLILETSTAVMPAAYRIYLGCGFRPIPSYGHMDVECVIGMELTLGGLSAARSYRGGSPRVPDPTSGVGALAGCRGPDLFRGLRPPAPLSAGCSRAG